MNIQSLRANLIKGQTDFTKDVVVVLDNKEYDLSIVTQTPDKVVITAIERAVVAEVVVETPKVKEVIEEEDTEED